MSEESLVVRIELSFGIGTCTNMESSLIRPFKKIFLNGKLAGKISYVFFEEKGEYFVLGSLCHTVGGRLLFFPSGNFEIINSNTTAQQVLQIDHFSLEQSLTKWHIKLKEGMKQDVKLPSMKTWKINDQLLLWFVLRASSMSSFEKAPHYVDIFVKEKSSEIRRRAREFMESREDVVFQICKVDDDLKPPYGINFEFFLSKKDRKILKDSTVYFLKMDNPASARSNVPTRIHSIELPTLDKKVLIRVTKFAGTNTYPWSFKSGNGFKNSMVKDFGE